MFIIHDGFYTNPEEVRDYALEQEFSVEGNYPGLRTGPYPEPYFTRMRGAIEDIIHKKITYWPSGYNTAFQYTTNESKTWTHYDATNWAAVVYLTPDAPIESGTGVYRHRETGIYKHEEGQPDYNELDHSEEDWDLLDSCGNVFNRIVLYEGNLYHRSILPGFGEDKYDGRLFQTFFFDVEDE